MTRDEAIKHGLKHYFTGRPCAKGHVAHRYVRGGQCLQCVSEAASARHAKKKRAMREAIDGAGSDCYVTISVKVHRDDEDAVIAYVTSLNLHRSS